MEFKKEKPKENKAEEKQKKDSKSGEIYSKEEEAQIKSRLRDLGYL